MQTVDERLQAHAGKGELMNAFYAHIRRVSANPFFAGVMRAYVKNRECTRRDEIDVSECTAHPGMELHMESFEVKYQNEKLNCIFDGRITSNVIDVDRSPVTT